jgi:hypothetical protein
MWRFIWEAEGRRPKLSWILKKKLYVQIFHSKVSSEYLQ